MPLISSGFFLFPFVLATYVASLGIGPMTNSSHLTMRVSTVLADGTSMQYSSSPLSSGLKWQASGYVLVVI